MGVGVGAGWMRTWEGGEDFWENKKLGVEKTVQYRTVQGQYSDVTTSTSAREWKTDSVEVERNRPIAMQPSDAPSHRDPSLRKT